MAVELPLLSAVVARLRDPEIHLAAYGGVVFPIALIVEGPIIMMLAASTALSRDRASHAALGRFMHRLSAVLTLIHAAIAFTPLYDLAVVRIMDVPAEVVEPARLGLQIMTPWTWAIAYRRFQQGVLIRFGRSREVTVGTGIRLLAGVLTLTVGFTVREVPGIVVATSAVVAGVTAEAIFAGLKARVVVREQMESGGTESLLRGRVFLSFYVPLAMTPLVTLFIQPLGAAAMARMPQPLESLAVWPVISGLAFMLQSTGLAYQEVVVAMLGRPRATEVLRAFSWWLCVALTAIILAIAATPLSGFWFRQLSGLPEHLVAMAEVAVWLAIPIPAMRALQSWYQGVLVHVRKTAPITESVVVFLVMAGAALWVFVGRRDVSGLFVATAAISGARVIQTAWVYFRSRHERAELARQGF